MTTYLTGPPFPCGEAEAEAPFEFRAGEDTSITGFRPADSAPVIMMVARPFDPAASADYEGHPLPCGEIGYPDADTFTVYGVLTEVRVATESFTTAPSHTPADEAVRHGLDEPFNFGVTLFDGISPSGGQGSAGIGELIVSDPGGLLDAWIGYNWDGRAIELWRGEKGTDPADWERVANLTCDRMVHDFARKTLKLRDLQHRLYSAQFPVERYGGTGGYDGDAALAGRVRPASFGHNFNMEPILINEGELIYQWHFRTIDAITEARDGASPLLFDADYATYADLVAATVPAGSYATCDALGLIKLETAPTFGLRVDGRGDTFEGVYAQTRSTIARRLVTTIGSTTFAEENLDLPSFARVESVQPAPVGIHVRDEGETLGSLLDKFMAGCAGTWTVTPAGMLRIDVDDVPAEYSDFTMIFPTDIIGHPIPEDAPPPRASTRVGFQRNWSPQRPADLGGSATADQQRYYGDLWRIATSGEDTLAAHVGAQPAFVEGYYAMEGDAEAEAIRQQAIYGTQRRRWRLPARVDPFAPVLATTAAIEGVNRLGWGASKHLRVIGIEASASAEQTTLHVRD